MGVQGDSTQGCDRLQVMMEDLTNMLAFDGRKGAGVVVFFSVHAIANRRSATGAACK